MTTPDSMPTFRITVAGHLFNVSAAGPGLGEEWPIREAVRQYYVRIGAVQGRWVEAVEITARLGGKRSAVRTYEVLTSRDDDLVVTVQPWLMVVVNEDPPTPLVG